MAIFPEVKPSPEVNAEMLRGIGARLLPRRIYFLNLNQTIKNSPPGEDQFVGWRYWASVDPELAIEVAVDVSDGQASFQTLTAGPQIAKAMLAAQSLENLQDLPNVEYEVRLLSIPGLLTESFWLKPLGAGRDWAVPYDTFQPGLAENHLYWMEDFIKIVHNLAEPRLAVKDAPEFARPYDDGPSGGAKSL